MNISLHSWSLEDEEILVTLFEHLDRRYLSNRLPDPYTLQAASWWLNRVKESEGHTGIFRQIRLDDIVIGNISIEQKSDVFAKDAEIGYYLMNAYSHQGIMSEAVRQIIPLAFETLDIVRITGLVYHPNLASRKILEKNGFVLEGVQKKAVYKDDHFYDLCLYGLYR